MKAENEVDFYAPRECVAVTGACLMTRRRLFLESGGFDAVNLPIAYNDIDYCFKLRKLGYKIICTPHAKLFHFESVSRGLDIKNSYKVMESFNHLIIQAFKQLNIQSSGFNSKKLQRHRQFLKERAYFSQKWGGDKNA